jgi:hypothetical protein
MFHTHGKDVDRWPIAVRDLLGFPQADRRPTSTIEELRCAKEVGS